MTPEAIADKFGFKLTALRKNILAIFLQAKRPLKAYDILAKLKIIHDGAEPPTVYRVLDFFVELHVVHRVESCQSYMLCDHQNPNSINPEQKHIVMLCNTCKQSKEVSDSIMYAIIKKISTDNHFHVSSGLVELTGMCNSCQKLDGSNVII